MDNELELVLLRNLEKKVLAVLQWTEWDQDCDEEPAEAFREMEAATILIRTAREQLGKSGDTK